MHLIQFTPLNQLYLIQRLLIGISAVFKITKLDMNSMKTILSNCRRIHYVPFALKVICFDQACASMLVLRNESFESQQLSVAYFASIGLNREENECYK